MSYFFLQKTLKKVPSSKSFENDFFSFRTLVNNCIAKDIAYKCMGGKEPCTFEIIDQYLRWMLVLSTWTFSTPLTELSSMKKMECTRLESAYDFTENYSQRYYCYIECVTIFCEGEEPMNSKLCTRLINVGARNKLELNGTKSANSFP